MKIVFILQTNILINASEDVTLKVTTYLSILTTSLEEWSEKQENRIND